MPGTDQNTPPAGADLTRPAVAVVTTNSSISSSSSRSGMTTSTHGNGSGTTLSAAVSDDIHEEEGEEQLSKKAKTETIVAFNKPLPPSGLKSYVERRETIGLAPVGSTLFTILAAKNMLPGDFTTPTTCSKAKSLDEDQKYYGFGLLSISRYNDPLGECCSLAGYVEELCKGDPNQLFMDTARNSSLHTLAKFITTNSKAEMKFIGNIALQMDAKTCTVAMARIFNKLVEEMDRLNIPTEMRPLVAIGGPLSPAHPKAYVIIRLKLRDQHAKHFKNMILSAPVLDALEQGGEIIMGFGNLRLERPLYGDPWVFASQACFHSPPQLTTFGAFGYVKETEMTIWDAALMCPPVRAITSAGGGR